MTEISQLDPTIVPATIISSTKQQQSASSSPITVDDQDWTQETKVDPKKILCTPDQYDSCYQTQGTNGGYSTNDKTDTICTPNNRHHQSSGSDPLSPTKHGVNRELFAPPKHQSTPLREKEGGNNNNNKKSRSGKNGGKSKRSRKGHAKRRPSEAVAKNQTENSSEEEESEEFEVFIAVPEKRTAELIGKQGCHLKRYYKEFEVDVTIIPGQDFADNFETTPPLKKVNNQVVQNVFRFESYYGENIKIVLADMQSKFWKADTIITQLQVITPIFEDFFNDYWHEKTYYAKSHFLQPKPKVNNNNSRSYNFNHSIPENTDKWESLVEQSEEERLRSMLSAETSFDKAMGIPMENDCPNAANWRNSNNNNQQKKKKNQRNQKKARTQKAKWRGKDGLCCPCTHLSVDKRTEAQIIISHSNPRQNTLYIQQPTHPSHSTLPYLEFNLFANYDPKGENFNPERVPSIVDREEARTCEHYVTVADPYNPEMKYVRGKIENYCEEEDVCTIFFCDYGGTMNYHRSTVFKLSREFCQLPFQACLVEIEPCFENDFGTQNSNISNSAGDQTQTTATSGDDEENNNNENRMRSSTVLNNNNGNDSVESIEPPVLSNLNKSPSKIAESTTSSNVKTRRNQFQKQILDSENVQFETHTDVSTFCQYQLFCEVVMEIEDIDREESIPHIRIFRWDFSKGTKQKIYIDYIPHLAPVLSPEPPVITSDHTGMMSPVPTENEGDMSFAASDVDMSAVASFILSDPENTKLFESLVQQNLQNLQLSTQSFAEIAKQNNNNNNEQIQNFNPEAQAFVPRM